MANVTFEDQKPSRNVTTKIFGYRPDRGDWKHISARKHAERSDHPSCLQIVTWNIEFNNPNVEERTYSVLRHIEKDVFRCVDGQEPNACCILLQEVNPSALSVILNDSWVQNHFVVTPISPSKWTYPDMFGNVTLISRSVAVVKSSLIYFGYTTQGRGAVVVDVKVSSPRAHTPKEIILRLINTHLESLPEGGRMRPVQLAVLGSLLRRKEEVRGGIIAGDMNSIAPDEHYFPSQLGLVDAWDGGFNNSAGHTWGHAQTQWPTARFDKILYVDRRAYKIDMPKRIGVRPGSLDESIKTIAEDGTRLNIDVSDHFGLTTPLRILR